MNALLQTACGASRLVCVHDRLSVIRVPLAPVPFYSLPLAPPPDPIAPDLRTRDFELYDEKTIHGVGRVLIYREVVR